MLTFGVPVKYFDSQAIKRFKKVISLAWLLSKSQPQTFNELKQRMIQLRQDLSRENIPCFAIPEIAAAVYSYTISRQAEPGIYIFFDVGSGTIEGASFRFWRENQMPEIEFYSGEVEPIGVNALAKRIANRLPNSENEIAHDLIKDSQLLLKKIYSFSETIARSAQVGEHIANKIFLPLPHWRVLIEEVQLRLKESQDLQSQKLLHLIWGQHLIHQEVSTVILTCKDKIPDKFKDLPSLRIFLGGGGRESEFYRDTIESTHSAFGHKNSSIPLYDVQNVPFPSDFDMSGINEEYFHRFAIAYGLSIPEYEVPKVTGFPKQFPDAPPPSPAKPYTPEWGRYPDDNSSM